MTPPGATIWRSSPVHAVGLLGAFLLVGITLGTIAFSFTLGALSPGGLDNPRPNTTPALIVGALILLALMVTGIALVANRLGSYVVVTDDQVVIRIGRGQERRFDRASTTFSSSVHRTFLNGVPSSGESRTLITQGTNGTQRFVLPMFPRRRFSLLMHELRTEETRVSLDEMRTLVINKVAQVSRLHRAASGTVGNNALLPEPKHSRGRQRSWSLDRRAILLRTLRNASISLAAILIAGLCLGVRPLFPPPMAAALAFIGLLGGLVAAGSSVFFLLRLPWQLRRIPAVVTVSLDELVVNRARFAMADISEISLTPPSYPSHARTLMVRPRRARRRRWMLGHDQPGPLADAAFPDYRDFAQSAASISAAAGVTLVWDLE